VKENLNQKQIGLLLLNEEYTLPIAFNTIIINIIIIVQNRMRFLFQHSHL